MVRLIDEFRDPELLRPLLQRISSYDDRNYSLMEVCGTHTVSISRFGIRSAVPENIKLLSGPGCPVCVTSQQDVDKAIELAKNSNIILATFGDMMKVPGTKSSLAKEKAKGANVVVCYSTREALDIAEEHPEKEVVFYGVGFETTAPTVAFSILEAKKRKIKNYSVFSTHKLVPPALRALLDSGEVRIDGFILPGHVSVIIGLKAYEFLSEEYGVPGVVSGFEPLDILITIEMLLKQIRSKKAKIENQYKRTVTYDGNIYAQKALEEVFKIDDAEWRGIGLIPKSGLAINEEFEDFDASKKFDVKVPYSIEPPNCSCGEVLRGVKSPFECKLFGKGCTPEHPVGPCMVSSEGACAAYYRFERYTRVVD
ncbi:MAG: hydrogenase formation protein HypD [Actinobacteria bacterium]|nr:hydrogenase formation protein HypD [Actinomycetota bacterium]